MDFVFVPRKITKNYSSICETTKRNLYSEFVLVIFCYYFLIFYQSIKNPYPKTKDLQELSEKIHLSKDKIRNWFKYQRKKDFKTKKLIITNYKVFYLLFESCLLIFL